MIMVIVTLTLLEKKKEGVTMVMDIFPLLEKGVVMVIDIFTFSLEKGEGDKKEGALLVAN